MLTVARMRDDGFTVGLIPHTLENTDLGAKKVGDPVNLEADMLGKYVDSLLGSGFQVPGAGEDAGTRNLEPGTEA